MAQDQYGYVKLTGAEKLLPKEETLEVGKKGKSLTIGVPREPSNQENRIAIAPQAAGLLIANGHKVMIENEAGKAAHFSNTEYSDTGARVVYDPAEVFKADIILKVSPLSDQEIEYLTSRQTLISTLHITGRNREYFEKLAARKVTAIAFEYIKDKTGAFPILRAMSEIVGTSSVFIAAEYLASPEYGKGSLLGGFPGLTPTEVVILGAGTVAEYAARAVLGLGATVKVFDNSIYKLRRLQSILGTRVYTSIMQPRALTKALKTADVVIAAVHAGEGLTPCLITEEMIMHMEAGSVIIDVSIDQGGCFETSRITSHNDPVFKAHGITHYCVPNIASRYPHTASYGLSNFITPILINAGEAGGIENMLKTDWGTRQGAYLFNGTITRKYIGDYFSLPFQEIELLMAAFR